MAKARLIAIVLASILASVADSPVIAADGVHWNGSTFLRATTIANLNPTAVGTWANSPRTRAGFCSYWFSAPTTAIRRSTAFAVYPYLYSPAPDAKPSVMIEHYPVTGAAKLHLLVQLPGAAISKIDAYSLATIPYFTGAETPQSKHNLSVLWDSWRGLVQMQLDGSPMGLDGALSSSAGVPFDFGADGMTWTVGAQLILGASGGYVPTNFLVGDTNEMYCVLGDSVYDVMTRPEALNATTYARPIYFEYDPMTGATKGPYPTDMGPFCFGVFGAHREAPYVCMRGNPPNFQGNDGLASFYMTGSLTPAVFSPFDLIPTTNP